MESEERTKDAIVAVFREVTGKRSGYERGLGEKVMPKTSRRVFHGDNGGVLLEDAYFYKA